jgi:hypothetical protein
VSYLDGHFSSLPSTVKLEAESTSIKDAIKLLPTMKTISHIDKTVATLPTLKTIKDALVTSQHFNCQIDFLHSGFKTVSTSKEISELSNKIALLPSTVYFDKSISKLVSSSDFNLEIQKLPTISAVNGLLTTRHFDSQLSTLSTGKQLESVQARVDALLTTDYFNDKILRLANDFIGPHFDHVGGKLEKAEVSFEKLHGEIKAKPKKIGRLVGIALRGMHAITRRETNHAILTKGILWRQRSSLKSGMSRIISMASTPAPPIFVTTCIK